MNGRAAAQGWENLRFFLYVFQTVGKVRAGYTKLAII
jgi:hypothetical protein